MKNTLSFYYKILDLNDYELKDFFYSIEFVLYSFVSFFIPFFLGHPQILIGSIVNCFLVLAAFNLKTRQALPIVLLPSLGVIFAGLIFGNLTNQLIFFIPFIWIGNFLYVFLIKYLSFFKLKNKILAILFASFFKSLFLFLVALALLFFNFVGEQFLFLMGPMQLLTALIGGFAAFFIQEVKKRFF